MKTIPAIALALMSLSLACHLEAPGEYLVDGGEPAVDGGELEQAPFVAGYQCYWNGWRDCNTVAQNRCNSGTVDPVDGGFPMQCKDASGTLRSCRGYDSYKLGTRSDSCLPPEAPIAMCSGGASINRCNTTDGYDYSLQCTKAQEDCVSWTWSASVSVTGTLEAKVPFCVAAKTEVTVSGGGSREGSSCSTVTYPCNDIGHVSGCSYCGLTFGCDIAETKGTSTYPILHVVTFKDPDGNIIGSDTCDNGETLSANSSAWKVQPPASDCTPDACGEDGAPALSGECAPDAGMPDAGVPDSGSGYPDSGTADSGSGYPDSGTSYPDAGGPYPADAMSTF